VVVKEEEVVAGRGGRESELQLDSTRD